MDETWEKIQNDYDVFLSGQSYNHEVSFDLKKQFYVWKTEKKFQRFPKNIERKLDSVNWILTRSTN